MTLSNLRTEKSLVEKAEKENGSFRDVCVNQQQQQQQQGSGLSSYRGQLPWTG